MKKPTFRNFCFVLIAISVAKTFRINEIASRWSPIVVAREKSRQKRFLRFLETPLPVDALKKSYFVSVVSWFFKDATDHLYWLVDETKLIAGWQVPCGCDCVSASCDACIKRVLTDLWNQYFLLSFFTEIHSRGDPLSETLRN